MGVKNQVWAACVTLFLILFAGSFLSHQATRLLNRLVSHLANSPTELAHPILAPRLDASAQGANTRLVAPPVALPVPRGLNEGSNGPGQPSAVADFPKESAHSKQGFSANERDSLRRNFFYNSDSQIALTFAGYFFGADYTAIPAWQGYFKKWLRDVYYKDFMAEYFPPESIRRIQEKKISMSFTPTGPVKLLKSGETTNEFLVRGVKATRSDLKTKGEALHQEPVALKIGLRHDDDFAGVVYYVKEAVPEELEKLLSSKPPSSDKSSPSAKAPGEDGVAKFVGADSPTASALRPPAERQALSGPILEEGIGDKAHPNREPRLDASTQGADSPSASALRPPAERQALSGPIL